MVIQAVIQFVCAGGGGESGEKKSPVNILMDLKHII